MFIYGQLIGLFRRAKKYILILFKEYIREKWSKILVDHMEANLAPEMI